MILHIVGLTPDCIDEIANNAINTDASPQIDTILEDATDKIELKQVSNKNLNPMTTIEANTVKIAKVKSVIKMRVQGINSIEG